MSPACRTAGFLPGEIGVYSILCLHDNFPGRIIFGNNLPVATDLTVTYNR